MPGSDSRASGRRIMLKSRILVYFSILLMATVAVIMGLVDFRNGHVLMDMTRQRGQSIANSLEAASSPAFMSYNYVALQQLADRAIEEKGVEYVIILDKEGNVAGYSESPDRQGIKLDDPIGLAAASTLETLVQKVDSDGRLPALDIAVPVYVEGSPQKWGTVRVGLSSAQVHGALWKTRFVILLAGIVVLGLGCLVALILSRRITGPLGSLVAATDELAQGNFSVDLNVNTGDEIEHLALRMQDMAKEIQQHQARVDAQNAELATLNASLETKVEERTHALTEAEEKYRLLVDHSPNPICFFQGGKLIFFNDALSEVFGYSSEVLAAEDFDPAILFDSDSKVRFRDMLKRGGGKRGMASNAEMIGVHRDGGQMYLDMRHAWITYRGEAALEVMLVDVTERKLLQEKSVSGERLRALGEMASGVAHDFNNILGTILARSQFLQLKDVEEDVKKGLRIIEKAATDGGETVKRIQEFSRVRKDKDFSSLDINRVLDDVIEMTRTAWEDEAQRFGKKIEVKRAFNATRFVAGNVHELREGFMNLLLNAIDAIEVEGCITLETVDTDEGVKVMLHDTGAGMSEEVRRRLFDPFYSTKGVKGTGLGMSIVYGIVTRHGASIEVQSAENQGTTFTLTFAEAGSDTRPMPSSAAIEVPDSQPIKRKVLVVDDEEAIRVLVSDILEESGYEAKCVDGGPAALEALKQESFDLMITDLGMPDMNGWELSREVRDNYADIRILLFTGWGASLDQEEAASHGVDMTLGKPFAMQDLLNAVSSVTRGCSQEKAA